MVSGIGRLRGGIGIGQIRSQSELNLSGILRNDGSRGFANHSKDNTLGLGIDINSAHGPRGDRRRLFDRRSRLVLSHTVSASLCMSCVLSDS